LGERGGSEETSLQTTATDVAIGEIMPTVYGGGKPPRQVEESKIKKWEPPELSPLKTSGQSES